MIGTNVPETRDGRPTPRAPRGIENRPMSNTVTDDDARLDALEQDLESFRISRDTWTVLVLAFAVFAALASIVGIGLAFARRR